MRDTHISRTRKRKTKTAMLYQKSYRPTPPQYLSTRAEVEAIKADFERHAAAAADRLADMLERLADEAARLADKVPPEVAA